ncbi:cyclic nucleotide-binding domain-containing protein [Mesorhizobium sp. BR1-1-16]|uniref:cyclic nucleotide-binding domain-containing protein n=1 Tax=Mesorhizobium sp. BR1-1-16 TaxID=2876653 RepID=UPI001CC8F033|nr:cyclic nucleotide-binding domain-containing protein [Mesorhizobium sp. BR1-1-16]MBZ9938004.1 cyclic nucleotide-binding domain-containing protein [Mesorhizobium sp. BR1-1-16]
MTLAEDISLLIRVPLFSDLSSDHLRLLAFSAIRLELPEGRVLFRKDAAAMSGFVVMHGEVEFVDMDKPEPLTLGRYGPGSLLGETALFVETRRPATARAATDCDLVEIDRNLMRRMLNEYPDVAARLHTKLVDKLAGSVAEVGRVKSRLDAIIYPPARAN